MEQQAVVRTGSSSPVAPAMPPPRLSPNDERSSPGASDAGCGAISNLHPRIQTKDADR